LVDLGFHEAFPSGLAYTGEKSWLGKTGEVYPAVIDVPFRDHKRFGDIFSDLMLGEHRFSSINEGSCGHIVLLVVTGGRRTIFAPSIFVN
jgi:hypothetical protein